MGGYATAFESAGGDDLLNPAMAQYPPRSRHLRALSRILSTDKIGSFMLSKRIAVEFAAAIAIVAGIYMWTFATQPRIAVADGRGFDGAEYWNMAVKFANGERPEGQWRYVRRIGTPILAAIADSVDPLEGFQIVNVAATFISAVLLLLWFRRFIDTAWLRVALVALWATHWLQLVRFTVFYPALIDPWTQVACFAGLNCIAWYEAKPGLRAAAAVAAISVIGIFFRELVILVPLTFLFARNPALQHLRRFPFVHLRGFPRLEQWVPLALAWAAFVWIGTYVIANDPGFSSPEFLEQRAYDRNPIEYLLGWMSAFGPALFIVLFDWRTAVDFFSRHKVFLAYTAGVAVIGWAGSVLSERHALNSASPIVYMLLGQTIERHRAWFRSPVLVTFLLATQAIVHRLFWVTPQYDSELRRVPPHVLLTPVGDGVTYLHLFAAQIPNDMVLTQFVQFVVLAAIVLLWLSRRAHLCDVEERTIVAEPAIERS